MNLGDSVLSCSQPFKNEHWRDEHQTNESTSNQVSKKCPFDYSPQALLLTSHLGPNERECIMRNQARVLGCDTLPRTRHRVLEMTTTALVVTVVPDGTREEYNPKGWVARPKYWRERMIRSWWAPRVYLRDDWLRDVFDFCTYFTHEVSRDNKSDERRNIHTFEQIGLVTLTQTKRFAKSING